MLELRVASRRVLAALALTLALGLAAPVWAAPARADSASFGAAPATSRDLSRYKEEAVPGGTMLVVAYGVMWALVAGFVGRALMAQARTEARIQELEERLEDERAA